MNRVSDFAGYYLGCGAPIKNAAARGHIEIVWLLVERGADPNLPEEGIAPDGHALANDPDALANAASEGKESFVRLMLRYQPDLPRRVECPGWAVGAKSRELNELLFQHGMSPSAPDWLGITPLHHFARHGEVEKATLFLDHGADLHARDEDICSTSLGWAAKFGQKALVRLLLERGAKPTLADDPPWATPLAWAMRRGHLEIVELLQSHKV